MKLKYWVLAGVLVVVAIAVVIFAVQRNESNKQWEKVYENTYKPSKQVEFTWPGKEKATTETEEVKE